MSWQCCAPSPTCLGPGWGVRGGHLKCVLESHLKCVVLGEHSRRCLGLRAGRPCVHLSAAAQEADGQRLFRAQGTSVLHPPASTHPRVPAALRWAAVPRAAARPRA